MVGQEVSDFVSEMIEAISSRDDKEMNSMKCIVDVQVLTQRRFGI
jgi:hypothetical protein